MTAVRTTRSPEYRVARRSPVTAARALLVAAGVVLALSLPSIPSASSSTFGLLVDVPGLAVAGGLTLIAALCAVVRSRVTDLAIAATALPLVLRLPTVLGTPLPMYGWTYKHLGVVDTIVQNGHVASGVDIYASWPGMFATIAWFTEATGLSPVSIAHWTPVVVNVLLVGAVFVLARAAGLARIPSLVAAVVAETVNWVGQDYFAPQAFGFLLGVVVLALLLGSRERPALGWLSLPVFAAIVVSHQLTPYWLIAVALLLAVLKRVRPRLLPMLFIALALGWLALNYGSVARYGVFSSFNPFANALTPTIGAGSVGGTATILAARAVTLMLWISAAVVAVTRFRRGGAARSEAVTASAVAFASVSLLGGQNYGGEAIFRVLLFSIPGCALLLAGPVTAVLQRPTRTGARPVLLAAMVLASALSLQAYLGGWFGNLVRPDTYAAITRVAETAPSDSLVLGLAPTGPNRATADYVRFARVDPGYDGNLPSWRGAIEQSLRNADEDALTRDLQGSGRPTYIVLSEQMADYAAQYGLYPPGALDRLVQEIRSDPRWHAVTDTSGIRIFRLTTAG